MLANIVKLPEFTIFYRIRCSMMMQRSLTPLDVACLFGHTALAKLLEGEVSSGLLHA